MYASQMPEDELRSNSPPPKASWRKYLSDGVRKCPDRISRTVRTLSSLVAARPHTFASSQAASVVGAVGVVGPSPLWGSQYSSTVPRGGRSTRLSVLRTWVRPLMFKEKRSSVVENVTPFPGAAFT